jgi:peptidyl-prolyl cis-trans isomerase C
MLALAAVVLSMAAQSAVQAQGAGAASDVKVPATVAKVNGKAISGAVYEKIWRQVMAERGGANAPKDARERDAVRDRILDRLIDVELMSQQADQLKIKAEAQEVEKKIQEVQTSMGGEERFQELMKAHGVTMEEYRAEVGRSLKVQRLLEKEVLPRIKVEPGEAKVYYDAHPQAFKMPEQVRARHIIIRVAEGATDAQKKEAMAAIKKAGDRVKKGEAFEEVAKQVSQDGTASNGGDLGFFGQGQMVPEFEKVAFSLPPGKVSDVVQSRFGYHLIKVEEKRPARDLAFQEVEEKLGQFLKRQKEEQGVAAYVNELKGRAKIERVAF